MRKTTVLLTVLGLSICCAPAASGARTRPTVRTTASPNQPHGHLGEDGWRGV
jgi:hypothetical protein